MTASVHTAARTAYPVAELGTLLPSRETTLAVARNLRNVALFVAAPFIGLVYAMAMPFVGLAMLAWIGTRTFAKTAAAHQALASVRSIALFAAAPFIGLVYAVLLPFVGIAMIAKVGYEAWRAPVRTV